MLSFFIVHAHESFKWWSANVLSNMSNTTTLQDQANECSKRTKDLLLLVNDSFFADLFRSEYCGWIMGIWNNWSFWGYTAGALGEFLRFLCHCLFLGHTVNSIAAQRRKSERTFAVTDVTSPLPTAAKQRHIWLVSSHLFKASLHLNHPPS